MNKPVIKSVHDGMNTVMTHTACGRRAGAALNAVRMEAVRLEKLLSRFIPQSDIGRLNRSAGLHEEKLSAETYEALSRAAEFSQIGQGLFDVTVGPLVALWRGSKVTLLPPDEKSIRQTLPLINFRDLWLNSRARTAKLQKAGQSVDLGGIGEGYAGDKFIEIFPITVRITSF
jgi:thiamine biosynthesis lipoprotein